MLKKPDTCKGCPMEFIGEGYADGSGPKDSKILFVGEALGADEVREGKPFAGGAGRVLSSLTGSAGIIRENTRVDNCMRCRPPANKIPKSFDPIYCAVRHLFPALREQKPNIIIALGGTPLNVLAGLDSITKRRGSIYKTPHGKLVATLHPAHLMRIQDMWFIVVADLKRAKAESFSPDMPPLNFHSITHPTLPDIQAFSVDPKETLASDIETTFDMYYESTILCIGFSNASISMCIPWLKRGGGYYWAPEDRPAVVREIQRLLTHPTIWQNGFFDLQVLESFGFKIPNFVFDTMLAHHLLYAELKHSLDFIASVHTKMPYYKDEVKGDQAFLQLTDTTLRGYNNKDHRVTFDAAADLALDLRRDKVWDYFRSITMKLPRILIDMQKRGILVNRKVHGEAIVEYNLRVRQHNLDLKAMKVPAGDKARKKYLFETLALPIVKRSKKTGAASMDKDAVLKLHKKILIEKEKYSEQHPRHILLCKGETVINKLSALSADSKILSTYLRGLPIGPDGRIHCSWLQHGTKNQRLSSRRPNLQNIPEGIARRLYSAAPGKLFYFFDYSQIELRIIAYEAEDFPLIKVFESGGDVHDRNTRDFFGLSATQTYTEKQRRFSKSFVYCLNYGGDVAAVLQAYPGFISWGAARKGQAVYYAAHPAIKVYRERIEKEVRATRRVKNPFGLERVFFGSISQNIKSAYNYPIQSGAAYIINTACIRLQKAGLTDGLLLQIHDALGYELPYLAAHLKVPYTLLHEIKEIMEQSVYIRGRKVALPVDIKYGPNWDDLKKLEV